MQQFCRLKARFHGLVLLGLSIALVGCGGGSASSGGSTSSSSTGTTATTPPPAAAPPPPSTPPPTTPPPPTPAPTLQSSVNHIILEMQENRSFDHYFGHLNDYRSAQGLPTDVDDLTTFTPKALTTWDGTPAIAPYHLITACIGDLSSSWQEAHNDVNLHSPNEGSWGNPPPMDGFAAMAGGFGAHTGEFDTAGKRAMGYYTGDDLPFYYWTATTFGTSDRWFSGALTRTQPNRMYWLAATSNGYAFPGSASNDPHPPMYLDNRKNIFQLLQENGITWKIYVSAYQQGTLNGTYLSYFYTFGDQYTDHIVPVAQFASDAAAGTLPQVAMIEPDSGHDEHPLDQIDVGINFVRDQVVALMGSPSWKDSIMIVTFDEGGGMYDHVPPASMPKPDDKDPILISTDPQGVFDTTGFRVPLMVISPFTKPHFVSHTPADFTAALKLIEARFGLPSLTNRDAAQMDMTEFFDWSAPNLASTNPPTQHGLPCYLDHLP